MAADLPEAWRLWETINDWWDEIETFIETRVTNARTEAANTAIKHFKRTGRGYRNHRHYQARILLCSPPADTPAAHTLESAGHHGQLRMSRKGGGA